MADALLHSTSLALLQRAIDFWTTKGKFRFVDLPWTVEHRYVEATRPAGFEDSSLGTHHGSFVCSGEQSFLAIWDKGGLPAAEGYVGWTPCIRNENLDELHQYGFMKAELFVPVADANEGRMVTHRLLGAQVGLFEELLVAMDSPNMRHSLSCREVGPQQWDIFLGDVEIGSYGWRAFDGSWYTYGTALAEPRFSQAIRRLST